MAGSRVECSLAHSSTPPALKAKKGIANALAGRYSFKQAVFPPGAMSTRLPEGPKMTELGLVNQQIRWLIEDRRRMAKAIASLAVRDRNLQAINARILALKIRRDSLQPRNKVTVRQAT